MKPGEWPDAPGLRFLIRKCLRRAYLCEDERELGRCGEPDGPEGTCPDCPQAKLDEAMLSPAGTAVKRAIRLMRRKDAGFTVRAEELPADVVAAFEILADEAAVFQAEMRDRREREAAVKRAVSRQPSAVS